MLCFSLSINTFSQIHIKEGAMIVVLDSSLHIKDSPEKIPSYTAHTRQIVYASSGTHISGDFSAKIVYLNTVKKSNKKETRIAKAKKSKSREKNKKIVSRKEEKPEVKFLNTDSTSSLYSHFASSSSAVVPVSSHKINYRNKAFPDKIFGIISFHFYENKATIENLHQFNFQLQNIVSQVLRGPPHFT